MSFPHRTAIYDSKTDKIIHPDYTGGHILDLDGVVWELESETKSVDQVLEEINNGEHDGFLHKLSRSDGRYIPLASTGLEDAEGDEVLEGHIMDSTDEGFAGKPYVVLYDREGPYWIPLHRSFPSCVIQGHILTDSDLVPDGFDVEEYFGLDE